MSSTVPGPTLVVNAKALRFREDRLHTVTHSARSLHILYMDAVEWGRMTQGERKRGHATAKAPRRKTKKKSAAREHARSIAHAKAEGDIPATALVTMRELSNYLQVSRSTLWKMVRSGQCPHYRVGHQYRFDVVAVLGALRRFT